MQSIEVLYYSTRALIVNTHISGGFNMLLKDKVAIITASASGFGRETALLFAKEGAKVIAVDYNTLGEKVAEEINRNGGESIFIKADVSCEKDVENFVNKTMQTFGKIDILFNNAGIYIPGKADELAVEDWDRVIDINLKSVYLGSKYAVPHMKEKGGVIINTASAAGIIGFPDAVSYAASKGGVVSLTKAMAVDYAQYNIRVNCICPGTGETGMTKEILEDKSLLKCF